MNETPQETYKTNYNRFRTSEFRSVGKLDEFCRLLYPIFTPPKMARFQVAVNRRYKVLLILITVLWKTMMMKGDSLKLTIGVPNYNGAEFLPNTILSCTRIPLSTIDYEILIVDNNSKDDSISILNALKGSLPNIRVVVNGQNIGRLRNWEKCINEARGKYFNFLFTTNEFCVGNQVDRLIDILDNDESISMCVSPYIAEVKYDFTKYSMCSPELKGKIEGMHFITHQLTKGRLVNGFLQGNLFRTEDIQRVSFDDDYPFCADHMFVGRALIKRKYLHLDSTPRIVWKIHLNSQRFHAHMTIQGVVANELYAVRYLSSLVYPKKISLAQFYSSELIRVIDQRLGYSHLLSKQSNYLQAAFEVVRGRKLGGVSLLQICLALTRDLPRLVVRFIKKMMTRC